MKDETKEVKSQVAGTISTLMTVAFGLIAALALNNAIQAIILTVLPKGNGFINLCYSYNHYSCCCNHFNAWALGKPPVQEVRIVE